MTTEPLRTSTRTTGPGVPQWATTNSRSRKNKIRPQAKEISAMIRLEKTKKGGRVGLEAKMADSTTPSCFLETQWTQNLLRSRRQQLSSSGNPIYRTSIPTLSQLPIISGALTFRCCLNSSRKGTGVCNRPNEEHLKAKRPNRISQIFLMHFSTD